MAVGLTACMETEGASPRQPKVSAVQAVSMFRQTCLQAPFSPTANIASFRNNPNFVQKGEPFVFEGSNITTFAHTGMQMEGSAGQAFDKPSCSVTFAPVNRGTKDAVDAATMLVLMAGNGANPRGMKGQGFLFIDYKGGKMSVRVDRKTNIVSLNLSKL